MDSEVVFGDVGGHSIRHRDSVVDIAIHSSRTGEGADRLGVGDKAGSFFTDVAGFLNTVIEGYECGGA